ncbi:MAG: PAS domain S-box protein, partial [Deltaproteobacteria bacterium]|nr:PAS domain S-box protein [Deltaproteobacteria bacterium]
KIFNIVNEKTREEVEDPVTKVFRKGVIVGLANHTVLLAKDGTEIPIDDSGAPIKDDEGNITGVVVVFHDIVERRKAAEALQESEEKYRTITNTARDAIVMMDQEGNISYWNPAAEKMFGYTTEEAIGKELHILFGPQRYHEAYKKGIRKFQGTGQGVAVGKTLELSATRKDGAEFPIELSISSMQIKGEWHATGIIRDITDRKQAEKEQEKLQKQFRQAQKMEAIGTLAGGIAHDFNNLLMGIQGYVSLMLNDLEPANPFHARLKRVEDQVKSGAELTAQLLGFARRGKYDVKPTHINEIVSKSAHMFGRTKKEITIREKYAQDLCVVEVDQGQIEQVLLNLYVNAWQAMPGRGELYLETSNVILDENYTKTYNAQPGRYIKISITDTGSGMNEATQRQIFDPFFTTKEMGRGTGLGLASAYGIIKIHGGMINVYSEEGHGTTFNIYLPALEATVTVQEASPGNKEMKKGNETILLVDDEQVMLDVGEEMLRALGYEVFVAAGGNEAIACYEANKDKIDIVVLDMIMPGMGGREAYDVLKRINPDVKAIISSGYNINGEATKVMRQGANDFIQKPFTMKELSHKIREVLDKE